MKRKPAEKKSRHRQQCVCVCVLPWLSVWFPCVSTESYKVVKSAKSLTDEMRTVMRITDIPVAKDSKPIWCEIWEIDEISIKKENFIENDKNRHGGNYGWLPSLKIATCFKELIGSLFASSFFKRINSCPSQIITLKNTLPSAGEMENFEISHGSHESRLRLYNIHAQALPTSRRRTVRIYHAQSGGQRGEGWWNESWFTSSHWIIFTVTYLSVLPTMAHHIHHDIHDTNTFVKY